MNRKQNAEQMLGVASNASPEDVANAFQARVSELSQKNLSSHEFRKQLNRLHVAHDLLLRPSFFESPFEIGEFSYFDNHMNQMRNYMREMNHFFDQYNSRELDMHNQQYQQQLEHTHQMQEQPVHGQSTQVQPVYSQSTQVQPVHGQSTQVQPIHGQSTQVHPVHGNRTHNQPYKYMRSFSKSFNVDHNGHVVGTSNKVINDNGRTFREEKQFDSTTNKVRVKRYKPDGSVNEFENPFNSKSGKKLLE